MKSSSLFLIVSCLVFGISCSEDEVDQPVPYLWSESSLSPDGLFSSAQFEVGDDGFLYTIGSSNGQRGVFWYTGNFVGGTPWVNIAEVNLDLYSNLETLIVFKGTVYFHVFNKLFKIEDGSATEILSGDVIWGIAKYHDTLVVSGEGLNLSNDKFTIATYDGTTFRPMSKELVLSRIIPANDKLYFQGFPAFTYDGENLDSLNFYGYYHAVDDQENIYFGESSFENFKMEKKHSNGQIDAVGNVIPEFGNPQEVELYDGTLFVFSAAGSAEEFSKVYFLNDNQRWVQIPTEHFVYDVVIFNNTLLSISLDGKIYELIPKL